MSNGYMKRILTVFAVVAVVMIVIGFTHFTVTGLVLGIVNAPKILAAAQTYAHDLKAHALPVPAEVGLQEMVAEGLLNTDDVSEGVGSPQPHISLCATI